MVDPAFTNGGQERGAAGAEVDHHRREDRGAAGVLGGEGTMPLPIKNVSILDIKMATLGAFWALLFTFQLFVLDAKSSA